MDWLRGRIFVHHLFPAQDLSVGHPPLHVAEIAKFVVAVIGKEFLLGLTILLYPPTPLFGMHMLALLLFDLLLTLCGLILIRVAMIIIYDLVKTT